MFLKILNHHVSSSSVSPLQTRPPAAAARRCPAAVPPTTVCPRRTDCCPLQEDSHTRWANRGNVRGEKKLFKVDINRNESLKVLEFIKSIKQKFLIIVIHQLSPQKPESLGLESPWKVVDDSNMEKIKDSSFDQHWFCDGLCGYNVDVNTKWIKENLENDITLM